MQQWEYHMVTVGIDWQALEANEEYSVPQSELARLGNKGWELVGVAPLQRSQWRGDTQTVGIQYIFKRLQAAKANKPATEMSAERASAIESAGQRNPASETAKSKFSQRAQRAAAKHAASNGKVPTISADSAGERR